MVVFAANSRLKRKKHTHMYIYIYVSMLTVAFGYVFSSFFHMRLSLIDKISQWPICSCTIVISRSIYSSTLFFSFLIQIGLNLLEACLVVGSSCKKEV